MLDKMKALPEKAAFAIGLTLLLGSGLLLFLLSLLFPVDNWTTIIVGGIIWGIAFLFIASAADKRHSRMGKKT
jgi:TM2 domain-containing membrane protein YozV